MSYIQLQQYVRLHLDYLSSKGYINGCGGKGGMSFDEFFNIYIKSLPEYDKELGKTLYNEIKIEGCGTHDIHYTIFKWLIQKIYADFMLSKFIFRKTRWIKSNRYRFYISIFVFTMLIIFGNKYFKNANKKSLEQLNKEVMENLTIAIYP